MGSVFPLPAVVLVLQVLGHERRAVRARLDDLAVDEVAEDDRRGGHEDHQEGDTEPGHPVRQEVADPTPDWLRRVLGYSPHALLNRLHSPYTPLSFMMLSSFTSLDR